MMDGAFLRAAALAVAGVVISAISQVMLKISANKEHPSTVGEYLNPLVVGAYGLFLLTTVTSTLAYKVIPLSMGPIVDTLGYVFVTFFGVTIFHERVTKKKLLALCVIMVGIVIYAAGL